MHPETRKVLKEQLKTLALDLRCSKKDLREHMKANSYKVEEQYHIHKVRKEYRHFHVAYCLVRGRLLTQVENKTSPENPLDMTSVDQFVKVFEQMDSENDVKFPRKPREEVAAST